jgi:hypothetical protein
MTKTTNSDEINKKENSEKVIETLYSELERKDKLIEKLKEENQVLIKTALKAENRLKDLEKSFKKE